MVMQRRRLLRRAHCRRAAAPNMPGNGMPAANGIAPAKGVPACMTPGIGAAEGHAAAHRHATRRPVRRHLLLRVAPEGRPGSLLEPVHVVCPCDRLRCVLRRSARDRLPVPPARLSVRDGRRLADGEGAALERERGRRHVLEQAGVGLGDHHASSGARAQPRQRLGVLPAPAPGRVPGTVRRAAPAACRPSAPGRAPTILPCPPDSAAPERAQHLLELRHDVEHLLEAVVDRPRP